MADRLVLFRRLSGPGGSLSQPVRVYDDAKEAQSAADARQRELAMLLDAQLVFVAGDTATPVGMSLGQFLSTFGITDVGHEPQTIPGGLIEAPVPRLIIPS